MAELVATVVSMVLGMLVPFFVQRAWARRLPPDRRMRMWNGASWGAALYAFGPLSMLGFVWITRRSAPHHEIARAVALVAGLIAFGMADVVLFTAITRGGATVSAVVAAVATGVFPFTLVAATARSGDRARDAGAIGIGLLSSAGVLGAVAAATYAVTLAYEALAGA